MYSVIRPVFAVLHSLPRIVAPAMYPYFLVVEDETKAVSRQTSCQPARRDTSTTPRAKMDESLSYNTSSLKMMGVTTETVKGSGVAVSALVVFKLRSLATVQEES